MSSSHVQFFGKTVSGPYTIPSGIVTVTLDTLQLLAEKVPGLGILTTKSIGPVPRSGNREPVYAQLDKDAYVNAVGLANPGCEEFAKELEKLTLPSDKALLISIFGGTAEDFAQVATVLEKYADAFELNFSCPHAEGYGQQICQKTEIAVHIVQTVKSITKKPVIPKLSPNIDNTEELVKALVDAGADGFTCINTYGPVHNPDPVAGCDILSRGKGGKSGPAVVLEGLRVVSTVRRVLNEIGRSDLPILGMGGISTLSDVKRFEQAGANYFGIGTALTGMNTEDLIQYFDALQRGDGTETRLLKLAPEFMRFKPFHLKDIKMINSGLGVLTFQVGQCLFFRTESKILIFMTRQL
eukprot:TRINITY_DN585_c0_g2_i16.p1 TRINITY_DN585_c0_g2~~TRINITY_DN585_c0_g2_i16.p1  ORF type:complete len:354 (+),score=82.26 TRINITY_DN585_c0_g2_i16:49-1110(+)